jgi:hypothetical protein
MPRRGRTRRPRRRSPLGRYRRIGVERGVIVDATPCGRNNQVVVDAIAQSGGRYRGVGNVVDRMTDRGPGAPQAG